MLVNKKNLDKIFNCDSFSLYSMEYLMKKGLLKQGQEETMYVDPATNEFFYIPKVVKDEWMQRKQLNLIYKFTKKVTTKCRRYYSISWIRCTHKK